MVKHMRDEIEFIDGDMSNTRLDNLKWVQVPNWIVTAVFDEGDDFGFVYTHGAPYAELFMLDVARKDVEMLANIMNVLAADRVSDGEVYNNNGCVVRCDKVEGSRRQSLLETHLTQVKKRSTVFEMKKVEWPDESM